MGTSTFERSAEDISHRRYRFTGDDLSRLDTLGILPPDKKYELLGGEILEILPPTPHHAGVVGLVAEVLRRSIQHGSVIREEKTVRLGHFDDPHPDVAVVRGNHRDYIERFPSQKDIALVIEVADISVNFDRNRKQEAYALGGLPEYWLVNLVSQQVEVYRQPSENRYLQIGVHQPGECLTAVAFPDVAVSVSELLGVE